jgi:uncharacterized membrane protein
MRNRNFGFVIALLAVAFSIWAWPRLPEVITTHWNMKGEADGYSSRLLGAGLLPLFLAVLPLIFRVLPRIDPRGENYVKFSAAYWLIANSIVLFLAGIHVVVLLNAMGTPVDVNLMVGAGVGLLLMVIGNYLGKVQPNWFLGIRTPWTLASEPVWRKTNRTAGWLFVLAGLVITASAFVPLLPTVLIMGISITIAAVIPVVQSYVLWKRERSNAQT